MRSAAVWLIGGAAACVSPAWSQEVPSNTTAAAGSGSSTLAEVVVTAQKRLQRAQDVGVSLTAIGEQGLAILGHQDVSAIAKQVPSLQVNQFSPYQTIFNIRGVSQNDISDGQEAPIAFYNDEIYIGALGAISGQTFDLERVEVLRGPQGTLFGRNATGGLIQVITAKPTRQLEGFASLTGGSFGQISSEAAISGPLNDNLRGRLSISTDRNDGFVRRTLGSPREASTRFYGGRAQIDADVGDKGELAVKLEYLRNDHEVPSSTNIPAGVDADGLGFPLPPNVDFWTGMIGPAGPIVSCPGCDQQGYRPSTDPFVSGSDFPGGFQRTYWSTSVRYDHDLGFAKLTSLSGYQQLTKSYSTDADTGPVPYFIVQNSQRLYQISQELRLAGTSGRLNWIGGLYGLKIHSDAHDRVGTVPETPPFAAFFERSATTQSTESAAGFAQAEYKLNPIFSVIVGGRYSADRKKIDAQNFIPDGSGGEILFLDFNSSSYPDLARQTYKDWSGKLELDAKPNTNTLLYLSVNRGTKSGGFQNLGFFPDPTQLPYRGEELTNYEGGYKLTLAGGKITFNGAAFHYVYHDYQAYSNIGVNQVITNHPAQINGFELELAGRPIPSVRLNAFASHLYTARVDGTILPSLRVLDTRIPQAPKWSVGGVASCDISVGALGMLTLSTNWKYDSEQFFTTLNAPIDREAAHAVGDVRISFAPAQGNWEAAFFVNNVTNRRYRLFDLDVGSALGLGQADFAPPRWFGGSLDYRFGAH